MTGMDCRKTAVLSLEELSNFAPQCRCTLTFAGGSHLKPVASKAMLAPALDRFQGNPLYLNKGEGV